MARDILVKNGELVTPLGVQAADLLILNGRIHAIGVSLEKAGVPVVDASEHLVLPGVVDPHVQLEVVHGTTSMTDDFDSGTRAAACGGVTTIIDFADQPRGVDGLQYLRQRKAVAAAKVNVDYSLHMSITDLAGGTLGHIPTIIHEESIPSFKLYLAYRKIGRMVDDGEVFAIMREVAKHRGVVGVHAESNALVEYLTQELLDSGRTDPRYFPESRPAVAEANSVAAAIGTARATGCDLYVHHVSTALAADLIARAKREGGRVWGETCPHYLLLTEEVYSREDRNLYVMNPPLRKKADQDRLWRALQSGEIDTLGTDHCSYLRAQKNRSTRFDQIPPGLPGIETLLPMMFSEGVAKGRLSLPRLVELLALNPARIFGLFPQKGTLAIGGDGDLVIFDPKKKWTLRAADLQTNTDFYALEGKEIVGRVIKTILRGEIVYAEGKFCGSPNGGRFVPGDRSRRE